MQQRLKSFLISLLLIVLLIIILWVGYVGFIGGPARVYNHEDQLFVEKMLEFKEYDDAKLTILNRFAFDDVYYIVHVEQPEQEVIVWFNKDYSKIEEIPYITQDKVATMAENFGIEPNDVRYGIYKDQLVYVLKKEQHEAFVNPEDLEVVFEVGKMENVVE